MYEEWFDLTRPFIAISGGHEILVNPLAEEIRDVHVSSDGLDSGAPTNAIAKGFSTVPPFGHMIFQESGPWEYEDLVLSWSVDYRRASCGKESAFFLAGKNLQGCVGVRYVPYVGGFGHIVPHSGNWTTDSPGPMRSWLDAFAKLPEAERLAAAIAEERARKERANLPPQRITRIGGRPKRMERTRIGFAERGLIWSVVSLGTDGAETRELLTQDYASQELASTLVLDGDIRELSATVRHVCRAAELNTSPGDIPQLYRSSTALFADHEFQTDRAFFWDGTRWTSSDDPASWRDELNRPLSDADFFRASSRFAEVAERASRAYGAAGKRKQRSGNKRRKK